MDMNPKENRIKRLEAEISEISKCLDGANKTLKEILVKRDMLADKKRGMQLISDELRQPQGPIFDNITKTKYIFQGSEDEYRTNVPKQILSTKK